MRLKLLAIVALCIVLCAGLTVPIFASRTVPDRVLTFTQYNQSICSRCGKTLNGLPGGQSQVAVELGLTVCTPCWWQILYGNDATVIPAVTTLVDGKIPTIQLGGEGADNTKFLRGDQTWVAVLGGSAVWGGITGTLSAQMDLQSALNGKLSSESDPLWSASPSYGITTLNISNWNAKLSSYTETDPVVKALSGIITSNGSTISAITNNSANWNTAFGWGNHASYNYLTGNQSISLSGDLSGSGTTSISGTVTGIKGAVLPTLATGYLYYSGSAWAFQTPAGGSNPDWYSKLYAAYGRCDPQQLLRMATMSGTVAVTPTQLTISIARIAYFSPPADIVLNKIRFYGVGATSGIYRVAIYDGTTLARLTSELVITTSATTWGSVGTGLALTLTANHQYFIAVSVNAIGTTAGMLCMSATTAATTGMIGVIPKSWAGNLDIDLGYIDGGFAQFAVTTGALPTTAGTIVAQTAWTGGFPLLFLDNNNN